MKYKFGDKIRKIREKKKVTMKEVAEKAEVSESMMSQIERNKVSPAIETLLRIADVLDIDLEYLFSDYKKKQMVNLVPKNSRNKMVFEKVIYEQLAQTKGDNNQHDIEAYFMQIEIGSSSGSDEYGHIGQELGVIIEGKGQFTIGNETYELEEGDSISFGSNVPHHLKNTGSKPLKAFWVITPPKMFFNNR